MDIEGLDLVEVARWPTGHTLSRAITNKGAASKLRVPTFTVAGPDDTLLFRFDIWSGHKIHWIRTLGRDVFLKEIHRKVLHDVVYSVLQSEFGRSGAHTLRDSVFTGALTSIHVEPSRLQRLLDAEADLLPIERKLAALDLSPGEIGPDGEVPGPQGSGARRHPLWDLRRIYQNRGSEILRSTDSLIGRLSLMPGLVSAPGFSKLIAPRVASSSSRLMTAKEDLGAWFVVISLDFDPKPVWRVYLAEGTQWSNKPDHSKRSRILGEGPGPVRALIEAGLLIKHDPEAFKTWLDAYLADLPDFELRFNLDPYDLLDAPDPLIEPLEWFLPWLKGAQPRW